VVRWSIHSSITVIYYLNTWCFIRCMEKLRDSTHLRWDWILTSLLCHSDAFDRPGIAIAVKSAIRWRFNPPACISFRQQAANLTDGCSRSDRRLKFNMIYSQLSRSGLYREWPISFPDATLAEAKVKLFRRRFRIYRKELDTRLWYVRGAKGS